ncbi:putative integrase family protein [Bordetella phage vB_BbrM_PHB04]|uniref:Integrase n=1 Tax=Bordetella phage vB_BbrM_PHB04 TaxID=2029657 RepID=A0A291LA13_9CAUD|nr:putative integrase family protein [Bordetella phage vB_BbrM_PHB04]ATI15731.1 putative integrase family protein [Bordetella phage vB_BbrM_PHB04]
MQKKITKSVVDGATAPATGDAWIWDTELQGFGLRIQASGRKVYVVRYRTNDAKRTQRKMNVCRASDATPDKARALARDIFMKVAGGEDPAAERKPVKNEFSVTLEGMFQARVAHMRAIGRSHANEVERVLLLSKEMNAADALGRHKHPSEVTPASIVKYLSKYYEAGHRGAADKARGYISAAFNWAITSANDYTVAHRQNWGIEHNPAVSVKKDPGASKVRDRNLSADEIRILWIDCEDGNGGLSTSVEVCLRMMIACGQRVNETLRIDGIDIDLETNLWTMPAHKTKGRKRPHTIPLPDCIIPDLRKLKEKHGDGPLFPSRLAESKTGLLSALGVSQAVYKYVHAEDCPIKPFQTRDLRRTWKSRAHDAGVDRFTRDLIQQHAKNDTGSKNYDRAEYLPQMTEAMEKWNAWLEGVIGGPTKPQPIKQAPTHLALAA